MITAALIASCNGLPGNILTASLILTKRDKWEEKKIADSRIRKKVTTKAQQALAKIKKQPYSESHAEDERKDKHPIQFATQVNSGQRNPFPGSARDRHDFFDRSATDAFPTEW